MQKREIIQREIIRIVPSVRKEFVNEHNYMVKCEGGIECRNEVEFHEAKLFAQLRPVSWKLEILIKKFLYFAVPGFSDVHREFLATSCKIAIYARKQACQINPAN